MALSLDWSPDCSGLLAQRLFPLAQRRHSLAKLIE
jgi:hypothetical protein